MNQISVIVDYVSYMEKEGGFQAMVNLPYNCSDTRSFTWKSNKKKENRFPDY